MTKGAWTIRRVTSADDATLDGLADVLVDCVQGGASVSFMQPMTRERAKAFWRRVAAGVQAGERALLVAEDADGVCGTVQLILDLPENQPHRADVAKMLVHRRARRAGLGVALMREAEETARALGRTVLVLDAVTGGDASRLYERLGWVRAGDVPAFALMPGGGYCGTTYYYRHLSPRAAPAEDREIVSTRMLAYRREQVFAAWSDPQRLARWFGPAGFTNTFETFDFRAGGEWTFVMHGPDGRHYANATVFREIAAPERIVYDHISEPRFTMTCTLDAVGAATLLTWRMRFETAAACERLKPICIPSNEQNFDRLEAELARTG